MSIFDVAPRANPFQAVQLCWKNWSEVCALLAWRISPTNPGEIADWANNACGESAPFIKLKVGEQTAHHGDWIVKLTLPSPRDLAPMRPIELFFVYPRKQFDKAFSLALAVPAESETLVAEQMRSEDA